MKANSPKTEQLLVRIMLVAVVVILLIMPVHAFISTWLGTTLGPLLVWKSWKEILLGVMVPIVIWYCVLRPDVARVICRRPVNGLIFLYVLLHVLLGFASTASFEAVVAGLLMNLRFLAIFVLAQIIAQANPPGLQKLKAMVPNWLMWLAVGLGILAILQVYVLPRDFLVQFGYDKDLTIAPYATIDDNPDALRAFATMRGPNTLGEFLLLPLAVALAALFKKWRNWLAVAAMGLGLVAVFLTGSRSAWLGALVTMTAVVILTIPSVHLKKWAKIAIVPTLIAVVLVGWAAITIPTVRLAVFHSSPTDNSLVEGSTDKHWTSTVDGIMQVVNNPWGNGPGSAGPASFYNESGTNISENYYVQIAQEVGVLGLGLFIAICVMTVMYIARCRSDPLAVALLASFVGVSLINLLLHGWADDPTALVWWALAGMLIKDS